MPDSIVAIRSVPVDTWQRFRRLAFDRGLTHAQALDLLLKEFNRVNPPVSWDDDPPNERD